MSSKLLCRLLELYGTKIEHRGQWRIHAFLRNYFKVVVKEDREVKRKGLKWILNPSDYTQEGFYWLGENDKWEYYHLSRMFTKDGVFFDVGSNFGYYAIRLAGDLRGRCQVYAFEPYPTTYQRLNTNVKLNKLEEYVNTYNIGFSDIIGHGHMIYKEAHSGGAQVTIDGKGEAVFLETLDEFFVKTGLKRLDFVKIDVEGHEEKVLAGASDTISRFKPKILIELNPVTAKLANSSVKHVIDMLEGYGYTLFKIDRKNLIPLMNIPEGRDYVNVFGIIS